MSDKDKALFRWTGLVVMFVMVAALALLAGIVLLVKSPVWALVVMVPTLAFLSVWLFKQVGIASVQSVTSTVRQKKESVRVSREAEGLWKHKIEREFGLKPLALRSTGKIVQVAVQRRDDPRGADYYERTGDQMRVLEGMMFNLRDEWWHPDYKHDSFEVLTMTEDRDGLHLTHRDGEPVLRPYGSFLD